MSVANRFNTFNNTKQFFVNLVIYIAFYVNQQTSVIDFDYLICAIQSQTYYLLSKNRSLFD